MGAPRFVLDRFWPSNLFLGGIPGAWYDPTDLSTMFQDSAGTTPVTAVEQPVGLILDKSQGLTLGAELVANGTFNSGITGWNNFLPARGTVSWNAAAQRLRVDNTTGTGDAYVWTNTAVTAGKTYKIEYNFYKIAGASGVSEAKLYWFNGVAGIGAYAQIATISNNLASFILTAPAGATSILIGSDVTQIWEIDNVSVRELAGNHASQSTAASRPTYRARYNLLTFSEQMDNGAWTKSSAGTGSAPVVTPNAAVAPDGTLTADSVLFNRGAGNAIGDQSLLSQAPTVVSGTYTQSVWLKAAAPADVGKQLAMRNVAGSSYLVVTLTADWVRYTRTETGSLAVWDLANRGTITTGNSVTALVWGAQLLTAADVTATGNAYQRIAAATVYDTAPIFRPYLAFDGMDDSLSTAAINFTSTDKMTTFAGTTVNSDAAPGMITELSTDGGANAGAFNVYRPGTGAYQFFRNGGTSFAQTVTGSFAAPSTGVVTYGLNFGAATEVTAQRVNGAASGAVGAADTGSGNFGTYPLFIGRRNNASLPFNGRLYSLIVRGAASSVTEIADTELWVNARTGGY